MPMLTQSAPSAMAAADPLPSLIPPQAMKGSVSASAAAGISTNPETGAASSARPTEE